MVNDTTDSIFLCGVEASDIDDNQTLTYTYSLHSELYSELFGNAVLTKTSEETTVSLSLNDSNSDYSTIMGDVFSTNNGDTFTCHVTVSDGIDNNLEESSEARTPFLDPQFVFLSQRMNGKNGAIPRNVNILNRWWCILNYN